MHSGADKPNIVVFILDMVRPDRLVSCGGTSDAGENFIDQAARRGTLFTHVIPAGPYTMIALNAMFTGLYGTTNGLDGYFKSTPQYLRDDVITLADLLKRQGYWTGYYTEYTRRAISPPLGIDSYRLGVDLRDGSAQDEYHRQTGPRFVTVHLERLHDYCWHNRKKLTPPVYDRRVSELAGEFESLYREFVADGDLVIVMSDHGVRLRDRREERLTPRAGCWREAATGAYLTDRTNRAFVSMVRAGHAPAQRFDKVIRIIDIAPTLLDMLGFEPIGGQGVSLWPHVRDQDAAGFPDLVAFSETGGAAVSPWFPNVRALRTNEWKFVQHDFFGEKLFRMKGEPDDEAVDLIGRDPDRDAEFRIRLARQMLENIRPVRTFHEAAGIDYGAVMAQREPVRPLPDTFTTTVWEPDRYRDRFARKTLVERVRQNMRHFLKRATFGFYDPTSRGRANGESAAAALQLRNELPHGAGVKEESEQAEVPPTRWDALV